MHYNFYNAKIDNKKSRVTFETLKVMYITNFNPINVST